MGGDPIPGPLDPLVKWFERLIGKVKDFPKNHNTTYRILNYKTYERFWWGRKPSSKKLFEEWLFEPKATMFEVSKRNGKNRVLLQRLSQELQHQGILERVKVNE